MDKIDVLLKFFYEMVNSDPEEVRKETEDLQEDIDRLKEKLETLIRKNLAEARIEAGKKLQQMFDAEQETAVDDLSSISLAARSETDNFSEKLSDEEKEDLNKLSKIKKNLDDKSRT
ncbi:MAG: hypothetical protein QXR30_04060 [Candidatus Woesearchaeota archaeon]